MQTNELLMTEHRLIELMLKYIHVELDRIAKTGKTDPLFVEGAVDFIRTYANRTRRDNEDNVRITEEVFHEYSHEDEMCGLPRR